MKEMVRSGSFLRFALGQHLGSHLEISNNGFEHGVNHNDTIVPVKPIAFHSSAIRFSAARLISNECFQRASASSLVGFFTSMIILF